MLKSYDRLDEVKFELLTIFVMTYAEALNAMGWELLERNNLIDNTHEKPEFCIVNNCEHVLEVSNEFVTEFLPRAFEK